MASSANTPIPVTSVALIVVSVIFPILSLLAILLRFKARRTGKLELLADDWWIIASWIVALGVSICIWIYASMMGVGEYRINIMKGIQLSLQAIMVFSLILQFSLMAVKISILFFYKRIFHTRLFSIAAWIAIVLVGCWGIIFFFIILFQTSPISMAWTGIGHFNYNTVAVGLSQSGTSIALDILVLLFPVPVLWSLQMPTKRKVSVILIFWLGAFCCVTAIVRLILLNASLSKVASDRSTVELESKQVIFMVLEPNCSIIAACLPCYGTLFTKGQTLGSIVRSARSIFSLRSQGSTSPRSSVTRARPDTKPSHDHDNSESQVELTAQVGGWSQRNGGHTTVQTGGRSWGSDEETGEPSSPGIVVQTRLDVSRN